MEFGLEIAKRIREIRIAQNLTQEELADKIGFDMSFSGRIERGKSVNLQTNTLEKIICALGVDYATLFSFQSSTDRKSSILNQLSISKIKMIF